MKRGLKIGTEWFRLVYIEERAGDMDMKGSEIVWFLEKNEG